MTQYTPNVKDPPSIRTTSTKEPGDSVLDPFPDVQADSATKHAAGSLGIAGALFMWLLFVQGMHIFVAKRLIGKIAR